MGIEHETVMSSNRKPFKFGKRDLDPNVIEGTPYFYLHIDWFAEFQHLNPLESCLDLAEETEYSDVQEHDLNSAVQYNQQKYKYGNNKKSNNNNGNESDEELNDEMDETSSISSEEIDGYLAGAGLLAKANVIGQHKERRLKDHKRQCAIKRRKEELKRMQQRMYRKKTQSSRKAKIKKQKELRAAAKKQRQMALEKIAAHSEKKVNKFQNNSRDIQINFRNKKKGDYYLDYSKYDEEDNYFGYEEEEEEEEIDEEYQQYIYYSQSNAPAVTKKSNNRSNKKSNRKANKKSNKKQTKDFSEYDSELQKALQASLEYNQQNDHNFSNNVHEMSDLERAIQESLNMNQNNNNNNSSHFGGDVHNQSYMGEEGFDIEQNIRNDTHHISQNNHIEYRGFGSEGEPEGEEEIEGDPYLRRALEESMKNFPNLSEEQQLEIALAESLKYMPGEENSDAEREGNALDSEDLYNHNYYGSKNAAEDLYSPRYIESLDFKINDTHPEAEIEDQIENSNIVNNFDEIPSMKSFPGYREEPQLAPQNVSSFSREIGEAPHNISSPFPGMNHKKSSQKLSSPFGQVGESPHKLSSPFGEKSHKHRSQKLSSPFGQIQEPEPEFSIPFEQNLESNMYHKQTKSKRFKNIENVAIRNFLTQQQEVSDFEFAQKLMEEEASAEKKRTENKWETTPFTEVKSRRKKKKQKKGKGKNGIKIPMKNLNDPWGAKQRKRQQEQKKKEEDKAKAESSASSADSKEDEDDDDEDEEEKKETEEM